MNISRSSQDGGGLATAHVIRVYPTQVQVVWPNDADHPVENFPRGWYSLEEKSDLIFIREDPEWLAQWRSKPRNLSSAFGSETTGSNILTTSLYPFGIGSPTDGPSSRSLAGDFAQSPYSDPERFVESQTEGPSPVWTSQVTMPDFLLMRTSPVKNSGDLYGQHDELMLHIRKQNALAALTGLRMPFE